MEILKLIADLLVWPLLGVLGFIHLDGNNTKTRVAVLEAKIASDKEIRDKETAQLFSRFDRLEERLSNKLDKLETHLRGDKSD